MAEVMIEGFFVIACLNELSNALNSQSGILIYDDGTFY